MATINLVPNPTVLVVQTGVFLANLVIVKKLILEPYLALKDKRESLTSGQASDAQKILADCETMTQKITTTIQSAVSESSKAAQSILADAQKKKDAILKVAEEKAKATFESAKSEIAESLAQEKGKVPEAVRKLADEIYQAAIH